MKNRILDYFSSAPQLGEQRDTQGEQLDAQRLAAIAEQWVAANPAVALGAALTLGVLIGWLVKRK